VRDNPTAAAELLTDALAMWRGEPYEDFTYDDFAQGEITSLREMQLAATEDRVDAGKKLDLRRMQLPLRSSYWGWTRSRRTYTAR